MEILKFPEFPLIHCSQNNEIVDRLVQIISIHEHNDREYRQEIERLKGIVAELQKAPKKPVIPATAHTQQKKKKRKNAARAHPILKLPDYRSRERRLLSLDLYLKELSSEDIGNTSFRISSSLLKMYFLN